MIDLWTCLPRQAVKKYAFYALAIVAILAILSAIYAWYKPASQVTKKEYVTVPQIKEVTKIKTVRIPVKEIVTIEKAAVVEKLTLPDTIAQDERKQITATGEIPPYDGKTNIVAITDTTTGTSEIIAKQQPLPFFGFVNKKELGARYGVTTDKGYEGQVYGRWTVFRVGSLHTALYVEGNTRPEGKAMIDVGYRW